MYNLSRDYERLYNALCAGGIAAGFVDYKWNPNNEHEKPMRDIVEIERRGEWDINLGCRGKSYGYVLPRLNDEPKSELECFTVVCKSLNLEWIDPFLKTLPHQHCKTHGAAPLNVWACPECLVMLREENKALCARVAELEAQQDPTIDDINAQDWSGMDGACAFSLIDRHADDWTHAGRLMNAWRLANPPKPTDEFQGA